MAYLETDKRENVAFYERFGFEVVGEHKVLGVHNRNRHVLPGTQQIGLAGSSPGGGTLEPLRNCLMTAAPANSMDSSAVSSSPFKKKRLICV